jgi:hypothetical protein
LTKQIPPTKPGLKILKDANFEKVMKAWIKFNK